jgi:hypothetical protein
MKTNVARGGEQRGDAGLNHQPPAVGADAGHHRRVDKREYAKRARRAEGTESKDGYPRRLVGEEDCEEPDDKQNDRGQGRRHVQEKPSHHRRAAARLQFAGVTTVVSAVRRVESDVKDRLDAPSDSAPRPRTR